MVSASSFILATRYSFLLVRRHARTHRTAAPTNAPPDASANVASKGASDRTKRFTSHTFRMNCRNPQPASGTPSTSAPIPKHPAAAARRP